MNKSSLTFGVLFAFLAVALGAFGAHGLKTMLAPQALAIWHTAVQYQMFHALALLVIGLLTRFLPDTRMLDRAAGAMIAGVVLFSGSLYVLALTGIGKLGMITPFGGVAFLLGWLFLLVAVWNAEKPA